MSDSSEKILTEISKKLDRQDRNIEKLVQVTKNTGLKTTSQDRDSGNSEESIPNGKSTAKQFKKQLNNLKQELRSLNLENKRDKILQEREDRDRDRRLEELSRDSHTFGRWGQIVQHGSYVDRETGKREKGKPFGAVANELRTMYGQGGVKKAMGVGALYAMSAAFRAPMFMLIANRLSERFKKTQEAQREAKRFTELEEVESQIRADRRKKEEEEFSEKKKDIVEKEKNIQKEISEARKQRQQELSFVGPPKPPTEPAEKKENKEETGGISNEDFEKVLTASLKAHAVQRNNDEKKISKEFSDIIADIVRDELIYHAGSVDKSLEKVVLSVSELGLSLPYDIYQANLALGTRLTTNITRNTNKLGEHLSAEFQILGNRLSDTLDSIPRHAKGGAMDDGPAIVGENGPEMVEGKRGKFVVTASNLVKSLGKMQKGFAGVSSTISQGKNQSGGKIVGSIVGRMLAKPLSALGNLPKIQKTEDQQLLVLKQIQKGIVDLKPKAKGIESWIDADPKGGGIVSKATGFLVDSLKEAIGGALLLRLGGGKLLGRGMTKVGTEALAEGAAGAAVGATAKGAIGKGLAGRLLTKGVPGGAVISGLMSGGMSLARGEGWGTALKKGGSSTAGSLVGGLIGTLGGPVGIAIGSTIGGVVGDMIGESLFSPDQAEASTGNQLLDEKKTKSLQEEAYKAMIDLRDMGLPALMNMGQNADLQRKNAMTAATGMTVTGQEPTTEELPTPPEEATTSPLIDEKPGLFKRIGSFLGFGSPSPEATPTTGGSTGGKMFVDVNGERRIGGSKNLRNNNPGNLRMSDIARKYGATTKDKDGFAIFPNMEAGEQAQRDLLFQSGIGKDSKYGKGKAYKDKTIEEAIYTYAPPNENNSRNYADTMIRQMGGNKRLSDLTPAQQEQLRQYIARFEGNQMPSVQKMTAQGPPSKVGGMIPAHTAGEVKATKRLPDASRMKQEAKSAYNTADTTVMTALAAQRKASEKKTPVAVNVQPTPVVVQSGESKGGGATTITSGDNETSVSSLFRMMRG